MVFVGEGELQLKVRSGLCNRASILADIDDLSSVRGDGVNTKMRTALKAMEILDQVVLEESQEHGSRLRWRWLRAPPEREKRFFEEDGTADMADSDGFYTAHSIDTGAVKEVLVQKKPREHKGFFKEKLGSLRRDKNKREVEINRNSSLLMFLRRSTKYNGPGNKNNRTSVADDVVSDETETTLATKSRGGIYETMKRYNELLEMLGHSNVASEVVAVGQRLSLVRDRASLENSTVTSCLAAPFRKLFPLRVQSNTLSPPPKQEGENLTRAPGRIWQGILFWRSQRT
mmetsp:Transcript_11708/g.35676  ORF Transcript_11708/g.35676 Transcript_11708/m.35676 type:complete len:287 (-) Transcript_11708:118-978(-)